MDSDSVEIYAKSRSLKDVAVPVAKASTYNNTAELGSAILILMIDNVINALSQKIHPGFLYCAVSSIVF